jgi:large subunit ribosomal protein L23
MIHMREIIIAPMITEKSGQQLAAQNAYTFKVSVNANKVEIKKAIERIFSVRVLSVNTINMLGKPKRLGKYNGKRPDWKKAIVTLKPGDKIAEFDV